MLVQASCFFLPPVLVLSHVVSPYRCAEVGGLCCVQVVIRIPRSQWALDTLLLAISVFITWSFLSRITLSQNYLSRAEKLFGLAR